MSAKTSLKTLRTVFFYGGAIVVLVLGSVVGPLHQLASASGGLQFTKLTSHPYASKSGYAQGDGTVAAAGRSLTNMVVTSSGKLIAGYGDWTGNSDSNGVSSGRVGVVPYDVATGSWGSMTYAGSEALESIRTINGSVYITSTDPSLYGVGGYLTNKSGTWQRINAVPSAVHVFDVATLTGSDLWLFGARDWGSQGSSGAAVAWRSTDGGNTWTEVSTEGSTPENAGGGFERYYWGASIGGKMYMKAQSTSPATPLRYFDGTSWHTVSGVTGCDSMNPVEVEVFDNNIICGGNNGLNVFDGTNNSVVKMSTKETGTVRDFYQDGGYLYVMTSSGVFRSTSLASGWQKLTVTPLNASSFAVYNGKMYIGTTEGDILVSDTTIDAASPLVPEIASVPTQPFSLDISQSRFITVTGDDFDEGAVVSVDGVAMHTSWNSSTNLTATLDMSKLSIGMPAVEVSRNDQNRTRVIKRMVDVEVKNSNGQSTKFETSLALTKTVGLDAHLDEFDFSGSIPKNGVDSLLNSAKIATISGACSAIKHDSAALLESPNSFGSGNRIGGIGFNLMCQNPGESAYVQIILGGAVPGTSQLHVYKIAENGTTSDVTNKVQISNDTIDGVLKTVIAYALVDGGDFDEDNKSDGVITDPVYFAVTSSQSGIITQLLADTGTSELIGISLGILAVTGGALALVKSRRYRAVAEQDVTPNETADVGLPS